MIFLSIIIPMACFQKKTEIVKQAVTENYVVLPHPKSEPVVQEKLALKLKRSLDVDGRQGVAFDNGQYFVSGTKSLHVYSAEGALINSNPTPLADYKGAVNHIGDIDIYNGQLYLSVEQFENGKASNMQIGIHDAQTLKHIKSFPVNDDSQKELSGLAIDSDNQRIWLCSWLNGESGSSLYEYDLNTHAYIGKLKLIDPPKYVQGIAYFNGALYMTADDGDALKQLPDSLYRVSLSGMDKGRVTPIKQFDDIKAQGEIEGLSFDKTNQEFIVHFNRGKIIQNGKPMGLMSGYETEIHELYIYEYLFDQ